MDEEERNALELSREELLAKEARGKPDRLARMTKSRGKEDVNTAAARIVSEATDSDSVREVPITLGQKLGPPAVVLANRRHQRAGGKTR